MSDRYNDLVITDGYVIDPALGFGSNAHIFIKDGNIKEIVNDSPEVRQRITSFDQDRVIDARDKIVVPGLIDMHVHLREPGREDEETVVTGCRAAAAGGFTSICCMPNTIPCIDNQETVKFVQDRGKDADARVFVVGAITKGTAGKELSEIGDLVEMGAVAVTDDGHYVQNPEIMRRALEYARMFDIPVMQHAEDQHLCAGSFMNESFQSTRLGLKGAPAVAEEVAVLRDIALCRMTGARLHFQHITTRGAVEAIRKAKREGVKITAEVTPHHLILSDEEIGKEFNTNLRVNPPLRTKQDQQALIEGLVDGTIDCIASDHAPHSAEEKDCEFVLAPPGTIGLETTLPLIGTYIVNRGYLSWADAIKKMTVNPARILKLPGGSLALGARADITVIDTNRSWTVTSDRLQSRSKNSAFIGFELKGQAVKTILGGRMVSEAVP